MKRRAFFGAVAAVTMAPSPSSAASSDRFQYRGWQVRWMGWREPVNQAIRVGFWYAAHPTRDVQWYSTTLGMTQECRPLYVLDMSREDRTAPFDPVLHTPEAFEAAKQSARQRLLRALS